MAIASMFLVYVKVLSELEDKKNRAEFFEMYGHWKKKERMRLLQHELYVVLQNSDGSGGSCNGAVYVGNIPCKNVQFKCTKKHMLRTVSDCGSVMLCWNGYLYGYLENS